MTNEVIERIRTATRHALVLRLGSGALARRGSSSNLPNRASNHPITRSSHHQIDDAAGFTMIELLVVLTLIIILATIGMTQYRSSVIHSREAVLKEDLFRMRDAIDQYYADKNQYPPALDALVSEGYMRALPVDPFTKSSDTWQTEAAPADSNNPTAEPGIYNIKSGSDGTALDGSKYSDW